MAWSSDFKAQIEKSANTPMLRFTASGFYSESATLTWVAWAAGDLPPGDTTITGISDGPWWGHARTRDTTNTLPTFYLDPTSVRMPEQRLDLVNMTCNGGSWSIEIEHPGDENLSFLAAGTFACLSMGFPGDTHDDFRRIAMGWISSITWSGARLRVVVNDLLSLLNGDRPHDPECLGKNAGKTTLDAAYTAGDTTISIDTGIWDNYADKDGVYTLIGVPTSGDVFVLRATGKTATTFTGVSAAGQYGTTAANLTTSEFFKIGHRAEGNPMNVVRNMLVSTGAGTNGTYDVESELMGYAVPDALVDSSDTDVWIPSIAPATGAFAADFLVARLTDDASFYPDTISEGLRGICQSLGPVGIWPVVRQGQVTCRALQDLDDSPITSALTITSYDVISLEVDWWAQDQPEEYQEYKITTESLTDSDAATAPKFGAKAQRFDAAASFIRGNETAVAESIVARCAPWFTQRVERVRLLLAGSKWAQLVPGDVVTVTLNATDQYGPLARGRTLGTYGGYEDRLAMVTAVRWNLPEPSVSLEVAFVPAADEEMPDYA